MKRIFTILFLFIFILASGYGIYYYWDKQKSLDVWSLVPENTILVYENANLVSTWNNLQSNQIWTDLQSIPKINTLKERFESLDSLSGSDGSLDEIFRNNRLLVSMNITAKDDFDFIFYQSLQNTEQLALIKQIESNFSNFKKNERKYNDETIYELKSNESESIFSYALLSGNFVGSFSPILVEDVIRGLEENNNFRETNDEAFKIATFQNDAGNLYINFIRLNKLLNIFGNVFNESISSIFKDFSGATFLDLVIDQKAFYLNGFTFANDSSQYLNIYRNQKGGPITASNLLPSKTAMLVHERFNNAQKWNESVWNFWRSKNPDFILKRDNKAEQYSTDFRQFYQFMDGENAVATLNNGQANAEKDKLIFVKANDINEALNKFNKLSEEAVESTQDTLYYEFYADKEIRELAIPDFAAWLLGPDHKGFSTTFFTVFDQFIVMSNNIQSIKGLMLDIETENTWGKSIRQSEFIASTLQESNLNIIIHTPQTWPSLIPSLNEKWKSNFNENEYPIKNLDLLALQFSHENDRFYTNIEVAHIDRQIKNELKYFDEVKRLELSQPIITKPFVVKNSESGLFETIVQDSSFTLHHISSQGQILWSEPVGKPIISDIFQIDFYKNNKLQFAFATEDEVFILDRNGIAVENYPKSLGKAEVPIQFFNVVDYDKSKNYRLLITKENGDIYLTDKMGIPLGDWTPLKMNDKIASRPEHIRIRSKDFMVVLLENGMVNVMSRNGKMKPNFPVKINDQLSNNLFFEIGNNFESSSLATLTNGGELIKISFGGKMINKQQLYMPNKETIFKMVPDATGGKYLLARQDLSRISMLKPQGESLFEKDYLSQEEMKIQYYSFGTDKDLIVVNDKKQQFTYIYTKSGQLINQQPIESSNEIAMIYYNKDNEVHVYVCHQNTFKILKFSF